ncbi:MAG: HD domain-containing protein [Lachnospiraceae bacterium]|nr:HD domain-containing protein [Lachnospiraceae bacterium]
MIAAEDIYSFGDHLLVAKGAVLTQPIIRMMTSHSVRSVLVMTDEDLRKQETMKASESPAEPDTQDSFTSPNGSITIPKRHFYYPFEDMVKEQHAAEVAQFKAFYKAQLDSFRAELENLIQKNTALDEPRLLDQVLSLLTINGKDVDFLEMMLHMKEFDRSIYAHSINTSLLCHILAGWLRMDREECRLAAACGLFHDIGKMELPKELLSEKADMTEEERQLYMSHTEKGYQFLGNYGIDETIKKSALMHHERCDGTGYPHALSCQKIDRYAKIVAICDMYHSITGEQPYYQHLSPFRAIEYLEDNTSFFDTRFIVTFLENAVNSYLNCPVLLNDQSVGLVVFINRGKLGRPVIQSGVNFIDLAETPELYVEKVLPRD